MNNNKQNKLEYKFYGTDVCSMSRSENAQQNPKEKSRIDANQKSTKSKKSIIPNGVKKFIMDEVQMLKATLKPYQGLETLEE